MKRSSHDKNTKHDNFLNHRHNKRYKRLLMQTSEWAKERNSIQEFCHLTVLVTEQLKRPLKLKIVKKQLHSSSFDWPICFTKRSMLRNITEPKYDSSALTPSSSISIRESCLYFFWRICNCGSAWRKKSAWHLSFNIHITFSTFSFESWFGAPKRLGTR